jgi:hypothetical protein
MSANQRAEIARRYLAEVSATGVEQLPSTVLMREVAELRRLLGQVLDVLGERQGEAEVLPSRLERATQLAEAMTADPVLTRPGDAPWTVQDVISAALGRGLAALEDLYLPGGQQ